MRYTLKLNGVEVQTERKMNKNKQDPLVQNVIMPVLPEIPNNPVLPIMNQNDGQVKEKKKEKEKVDKLYGEKVIKLRIKIKTL